MRLVRGCLDVDVVPITGDIVRVEFAGDVDVAVGVESGSELVTLIP